MKASTQVKLIQELVVKLLQVTTSIASSQENRSSSITINQNNDQLETIQKQLKKAHTEIKDSNNIFDDNIFSPRHTREFPEIELVAESEAEQELVDNVENKASTFNQSRVKSSKRLKYGSFI